MVRQTFMNSIELYDTTLRDGAQYEGISLSVDDKIAITKRLDSLGVHYIEGGWPGSNPKDKEYFDIAKTLKLKNAIITAFGSTRRAGVEASDDLNIKALVAAETSVITLVGKSSDLQVLKVLEVSLEENLSMIFESISYLKSLGKRVFFDAEHFFDGYKSNQEYSLKCLKSAESAGAEVLVLCDTNGGTLPTEITNIIHSVSSETNIKLGIHTHNDADSAVAGSIAAVEAGVFQIQGTINGYGERCGNANLISIIANLKLKMGIDCITDEQMEFLTDVSLHIAEIANMRSIPSQPYVGSSAFAHKGGIHAAAVQKIEDSYQHIKPSIVGNDKRILVSELSGRSNVLYKVTELGIEIKLSKAQARQLVEDVKEKENNGFQYEGAEASFEVLVRKSQSDYLHPFEVQEFMTVVQKHTIPNNGNSTIAGNLSSQVMLKIKVGDQVMHTASDGNGPVNAIDNALRKALLEFYPELKPLRLTDYKVRVVDGADGTGAIVRVIIESTDGSTIWSTVGASSNIITASLMALTDSMEYWLARNS